MAVVRAFRAVMPRHDQGEDVTLRCAPPYDVISDEQRLELLATDPHNVVALELPEGPLDPEMPGNRYETGRELWRSWRADGSLVDDSSEAVYVVEQEFELAGRVIRRRSLVAAVDLEPFERGVILPHERTLARALDDRMLLLRSTAANLSPVFALFSDPESLTDRFFESAVVDPPLLVAVDADGVVNRVWALRDEQNVAALRRVLAEKTLFIADGHHRYTTALAYADEVRSDSETTEWRPSDSIMMALANMDDPNLLVLPAHRVAKAASPLDPRTLREGLAPYFDLKDAGADPIQALDRVGRTAFVVRTPADGTTVLAVLRQDVDPVEAIKSHHSEEWKRLDVAVLQELVLGPLLQIHPDRPDTLDRLAFVKDADRALVVGDCDAVFLVRATKMGQLRAVASAGETMPQKSTYFYPKLLSGLLMRSLD